MGKKPTYLGKNPKIRPYTLQKSAQFFEKLKKAHFAKFKSGRRFGSFLKVFGRNLQKEEGMNPSF
jgi:hypothetical protein